MTLGEGGNYARKIGHHAHVAYVPISLRNKQHSVGHLRHKTILEDAMSTVEPGIVLAGPRSLIRLAVREN